MQFSQTHPRRGLRIAMNLGAAAIALNLLALALPIAVLQIYDRVIPNLSYETLGVLAAGLVAVIVIEVVLRLARDSIVCGTAIQQEHTQILLAVDRLLHADAVASSKRTLGWYLDSIRRIEEVHEFHSGPSQTQRIDTSFAACNLFLMATFTGTLVLVPILVIVVFSLLVVHLTKRLRHHAAVRSEIESARQDFLLETMDGIHALRSTAVEDPYVRRCERIQADYARNSHESLRIVGLIQAIGVFGSQLIIALFVSFGALRVLDNILSVGALAAGTMLAGRILQPLIQGIGIWASRERVADAKHAIEEILSLEQVPERVHYAASGAVELRDVDFAFGSGTDHRLFHSLNLSVAPGEAVGITGASGSGRSSLLRLVKGVLEPTSGHVHIDGKPASSIEASRVSLLPQNGTLFRGTLLDNIEMGRGNGIAVNGIRLAQELGLVSTLEQLPLGLDTPVNSGDAVSVSSGTKQRLLMARNLASDPSVVLIDDANSFLDPVADDRFFHLLKEFKSRSTMIVCSEQPVLLSLCDRVYRIEGGSLVRVLDDRTNAAATTTATASTPTPSARALLA